MGKHKDICRQLRAGHSVRNAAKICGKGISTVQRVQTALRANKIRLTQEALEALWLLGDLVHSVA